MRYISLYPHTRHRQPEWAVFATLRFTAGQLVCGQKTRELVSHIRRTSPPPRKSVVGSCFSVNFLLIAPNRKTRIN